MDKKKGVKLGVCSLLVGLLALTACGKKTSKKDNTTVKPTTTEKTTKEKTTTEKQTTKQEQKQVKGFNVYVDDVLAPTTGDNAVIEFEYADGYDYLSHIKVELVYTDDTKEEITTGFNAVTDITETSECASATEPGIYNLAISYGTFDAVNIDLIVNQKVVDMSSVAWDYTSALTYNGEEQSVTVKNLPKGVVANYTNNKATNVGNYKANVTFEAESINYIVNTTSLAELDWTINKLIVDVNDLTWNIENGAHLTYNGETQEVKLTNVPQGLVVNYTGNTAKNAGSTKHTAVAEFEGDPNIQYGSTGSLTCEYYIDVLYVDVENFTWNYTEPFTYDGEEHEVTISNLPKGLQVAYSDNIATNADNYSAVATFTEDSGNIEFEGGQLSCSLPWKIQKRTYEIDIKDVEFIYNYDENYPLYYTGDTYTIMVNEQTLPDGVSVSSYENGEIVNAGTYVFRAYLEGDSNTIISPSYIEKEITIGKADAKINSIKDPSKTYDGKEVQIEIETNVSVNAVIYYKPYGANDLQYTTNAPKNAGLYTAKIVIEDTTNYNGCEDEIIDFEIFKKVIQPPNRYTVTSYTGDEQSFCPEGLVPEIMEFVEGSGDDPIQMNVGKYTYYYRLINAAKTNYVIYDSGYGYSCIWQINGDLSDYLDEDDNSDGIYINSEPISIKDFEALEYLKDGDKIEINEASGFHVEINDIRIGMEGPAEYTIDGNSEITIEVVDNYGHTFYRKDLKVYNSYQIYSIFIDDEEYVYDGNPIFHNTKSDKITLDFGNINLDYVKRIEIDGQEIDINNPIIDLSVDDIKNNRIEVRYYDEDDSYSGFFIFVNQDLIVSSLDIILLDTTGADGNVGKSIHIENDGYGTPTYEWDSKEVFLAFYDSTILDIKVNLMDGYEKYTYGFYYYYSDEDDYEKCDFANLDMSNNNRNIYLVCFNEDGEEAYRIRLCINCDTISFNSDTNITYLNDKNVLVSYDGNYMVKLDEYSSSWSIFDCYINDAEMADFNWTNDGAPYTEKGVYREKFQLKNTHLGLEYTRYFYVDIIYTNPINTYADRIGLSYLDYSDDPVTVYNGSYDEYAILDGKRYILGFDESGNEAYGIDVDYLIGATSQDLYVDLKAGYSLDYDLSTIAFDNDNKYAVIKYVFTDSSDNNYEVYAIVYYYGDYSNNTNIVDEKIVRYNNFVKDEKVDFLINENVVNITNASVLFEYNFKLEEEGSYELFDSNEESIASNSGVRSITLEFAKEDTYLLVITAKAGATREITINVSGDFGNLIETSIGNDGTKLYLDNDFEGNFIVTNGPSGTSVKGYYGSDSQEYIVSGQVEINIDGVLVNYMYKDASLNEKITSGTDTLDVHDIDTKPYVVIYMPNYGEVILYLIDKPIPKAIIELGDEDDNGYAKYGFIFDENGIETDATMGYYPYAMVDEYVNTITLTLTKAYSDYSYSIIAGDADFVASIMEEGPLASGYTFAGLEESNHLYRVDSNTLTVSIPIQYMYFFITAEGVKGTDTLTVNNIMPVLISEVSIFDFDGNFAAIYMNNDYEWTCWTDAYDAPGELDNDLGIEDLPNEYYYFIGEAELSGVVDGKYTISYSSNLSSKLYSDITCENEIEIVNGLVTLDVLKDDAYFCEVFVKTPIADDPVKVVLAFVDPEEEPEPEDFPDEP